MKKIAFIALLALIIVGWWYALHRSAPSTTVVNTPSPTAGHPDPSNGSFMIDDQRITLKNGKTEMPAGPSGVQAEVELTNVMGYGDLNADGKEDAAAVLVQSGPGSGVFLSVVAYVSGPITYKGTNAVFIGDRVEPQSVSIKNGVISVTYLDRRADEPYTADPTVKTTKTFTYHSLDNTIE